MADGTWLMASATLAHVGITQLALNHSINH